MAGKCNVSLIFSSPGYHCFLRSPECLPRAPLLSTAATRAIVNKKGIGTLFLVSARFELVVHNLIGHFLQMRQDPLAKQPAVLIIYEGLKLAADWSIV